MGLLRGAVAVWAASLDGKKAADQKVSTKKNIGSVRRRTDGGFRTRLNVSHLSER